MKKTSLVLADKRGFFGGGQGGIRPALRGRPPRGKNMPPACFSTRSGSNPVTAIHKEAATRKGWLLLCGGQGGIRTHEPIAGLPDFECCTPNRL